MLNKRTPLQIGQAVERLMMRAKKGSMEDISIYDCDQRYLAENITATNDIPLFTRSGYDGYALRSRDTAGADASRPIEFKVLEILGAGMVPTMEVGPFQATRIMTGAMLPKGADAVIMLEGVKGIEKNGGKYIRIKRMVEKGTNISFQGEEVKKGDVVLHKGTLINPGVKAVLATFGYRTVIVTKKPRVGIFATGSELLDLDEPLQNGKIRNSNAYMLASQIKRTGADPIYFGKLPDHLETSVEAISSALNKVDFLITTGGVSVGDYDLMPEVYSKINATVLFNKIKMRPGSVTTVAEYNGKLLFGLSGNPSASFVGFELFVRPIIRSWFHSKNPHLKKVEAILDTDFPKANPFTRLVRSKLLFKNHRLFVTSSGMDKSNIVTSLIKADTLTLLPGAVNGYKKGDIVEALLLEDHEGCEWPWDKVIKLQ